jgi:hypothetical protein
MTPSNKLYTFLGAHAIIATIIVICVSVSSAESDYWNIGPHENLEVISVMIDTWGKWFLLIFIITLFEGTHTVVEKYVRLLLKNNKTELTDAQISVSKAVIFFMDKVRALLWMLLVISQIDIAVWPIITSFVTYLLITKYSQQDDNGNEMMVEFV